MRFYGIDGNCPEGMSEERYVDILEHIKASKGLLSLRDEPIKKDGRVYQVYIQVTLPRNREFNKNERNQLGHLQILIGADNIDPFISNQKDRSLEETEKQYLERRQQPS